MPEGRLPASRPSQRAVRVRGHMVRYEAAGEGEPVVLVHGLSGSSLWWSRNVGVLAERYRVYVLDLPGFGVTRHLRQEFVLSKAALWLSEWMDAAHVGRAHLVGHSMGGFISLRLAAMNPEAVRRLTLVAPAGMLGSKSMLGYALPLLLAARYAVPRFLPVLFYDALRMGPHTLWRAARDILAEDVREDLRLVGSPTLLVWGENDPLIPPSIGMVMREEMPDSRLLTIEGAGHVPMFDRPEEFNAALPTFLSGGPVGE